MDAAYRVEVRNRTYTIVDDPTSVYRALITGVVNDEITGEPPGVRCDIRVDHEGLHPKVLQDGLFCISGYLERVFPNLDTTSHLVNLVITASDYRDFSLRVEIPSDVAFPVDAGKVVLRRSPVRLQGRVTEDTTERAPIPNARIRTMNNIAALRTPLYFAHAKEVPVRQCQLNPVGSAKQLTVDAIAGKKTIVLENRLDLAMNDLLRIGPEISVEYAMIESLSPDSDEPSRPGEVMLHSPLSRSFSATTAVQKVIIGDMGIARRLEKVADMGDCMLILDGDLLAETIEIADPVPELMEYHALGALTDSEGFYHLDGIGRIKTVHLNVSAVDFATLPEINWTITYGQPINIVNFMLLLPS